MLSCRRLNLIILLTFFLGLNAFPRTIDEIKKSGKLIVAFDPADLNTINYPLALEFAKYLNLEIEEVIINWDEVFSRNGMIPDDLETNPNYTYTPDALQKADIICSTFTIVEWRKKLFDFAETLVSAELLVVPGDYPEIEGLENLKGMKIGMMGGTSYVSHLELINQKIGGGIMMVQTETSELAKTMLLNGDLNGLILDADEALTFIKENNNKFRYDMPINQISKSAWAIEKNNPLREEVENFFRTIENNGTLDALFEDRFGVKYSEFAETIDPHTPLEPVHRDLDEILESKKIIVALRERDFVYSKTGEKQFMHALAEEFSDYLGVKMEYVVVPDIGAYWENSQKEIDKDSVYTPEVFHYFDVAADLISPLDWRERKVDLITVYTSQYSILARPEINIRSIDDLKNYLGITAEGTLYEEILINNGIDSLIYGNVSEFVSAVETGRADYTMILNAFLYPQLERKISLGTMENCWALRKDQPELKKAVEQFINESEEKGLLNALNKVLEGRSFLSPGEFIKNYYEKFQTGYLPYIVYGAEDGLPQEDITAIFQDQKGYMWFGTNSGVVRYNGRYMEVFDISSGLSDNSISDIKEDQNGRIYFSTSKGISVFDNDSIVDNVFTQIAFNSVFIDRQNNKWFLSNDGIYMLDHTGRKKMISQEIPQLPSNVNAIAQDTTGMEKYFATNDGIYIQIADQIPIKLISDHCYTVFIDGTNHIWFSTSEGFFQVTTAEIKQNFKGNPLNQQFNIPFSIIKKISQSKSGSIWFMNDSHLYQVVSMDQEARAYESGTDLMNNTVLSYWEDNEENLWIGFSGGLQRIINNKNLRNFFPDILDNYIYGVTQDAEGRIWIGTNDGVYYYQDELVNFSSRLPTGESKTVVTRLSNGNLLMASTEGLFEYDVRSLSLVRQNKLHILDGIENLFITSRGQIFVLTGKKGIIYYFESMGSEPVVIQSKETASIFQMVEFNGALIAGSNRGLVAYNGEMFYPYLELNRSVWSLCVNENKLWLGTEQGLAILNNNELELVSSTSEMVVKTIIPAKSRNHFWIGTNLGLIYFNKTSLKIELQINSKEGLSGDEITSNGLYLDENGLLWVGTYHGLSSFNIKAQKEDEYSPRCYLEKIIMNGEEIELRPDNKFRYNENNFVFELSGLFFSDERSIEYEFYLRGLKDDYNLIRRGREYRAYYTNNPPGKYEFVYRARGKDNIWSYTQSYSFEIKKPFWETWWFRIIAILIIIFLINLLYKLRLRQVQRQKKILEEQVRERTVDLENANEEIQAQRDLAENQRDQITIQKKEITDSIQYAERIQRSLLPSASKVENDLADYFVLFKPRDIVSGDFYWTTDLDQYLILVAADCTGHGVPGAFMSMLGISFLNEIVNKNHIHESDQILNMLRTHIIEALQQKGGIGEAKDGMDMAICVINKQTQTMQFSGANNPLYFIRNGDLEHFKGDKMPVAIHVKMQPFQKHEIQLKKDDTFYLFSDGFVDQFGGPAGGKFKYKPFRDLLLEIHRKPMQDQKEILDQTFEEWKGNFEQIDDVVILGCRI